MSELVILVDEKDNQIGVEEKLKAHQEGTLHRAFSIFILNSKKELLLQRRAFGKYHSPGLWTNTCCSHPRPDETVLASAHRRLREEMGFDCDLSEIFTFQYKVSFDNGLTEHELDHVIVGSYEKDPIPNLAEVAEYKWVNIFSLEESIEKNPELYTEWLKICYQKVKEYIKENLSSSKSYI